MRAIEVKQGSIAEALGIKAGDLVKEINGEHLRDIIDYKFLSSDDLLEIVLERDGDSSILEVEKPPDKDLGIVFEEMKVRRCENRCVFCFIDQMPLGMRRDLYIKDDDYRLSFLHGAYITLTNLSNDDFQRIVRQRLSPIYVSVHVTEPSLRRRMLGRREDDDILGKIGLLSENGIEVHCQIVLCPGFNDKDHLEKTMGDLSKFFPQVRSVAIVPVGLTRHREHLTPLMPVGKGDAQTYVSKVERWQDTFKLRFGERFVYLADEFYLLAGAELPSGDHYDGFPQIENGVGMVRSFLDDFRSRMGDLSQRISPRKRITLVTGVLAVSFMSEIARDLNRIPGLWVELFPVENDFFGDTITVSGLLTGRDVLRCLEVQKLGDIILLPPNCVNHDGLLLDDVSPDEMGERLGRPVVVSKYDLVETVNELLKSPCESRL